MTLRIYNNSDGSVQLRGFKKNASSEEFFACNSGEGKDVILSEGETLELMFIPYPIPIGHKPVPTTPSADVSIMVWKRVTAGGYTINVDEIYFPVPSSGQHRATYNFKLGENAIITWCKSDAEA